MNDDESAADASSRPGQSTAAQINQLRHSMNQPRQSSRPAAPSMGRQHLSEPGQSAEYDEPDDHIVETSSYAAYPDPSRNATGQERRSRSAAFRNDPHVEQDDQEDPGYPNGDEYDQHFEDDEGYEDYPPIQRRPPGRPRSAAPRMPTLVRPSLPPVLARADLMNDVVALALVGVALVGLAAMAIVVGNQTDSLAPGFATHVSASGLLENFKPARYLWQLPLLATMITLMNLVAAWFISPIDRFASRFLIGSAVVVQFLSWVALIRIL